MLRLLLMFLVGGAAGFLLARFGTRLLGTMSPAQVPALLAGFVLAFWPHIVLHEAGHAIAGVSRGMHAIAFGVGPFRCERGAGGWRWRYGGGIRGIGGFAALLPKGRRGLSPLDQAIFLVGGPAANLLTAALLWSLIWWVPMAPLLRAGLDGATISALLMGLANLVPFHTQGWRSDGRGLLDLLRRSPDAALQLQVNQLMALSLAGVRPRDWPHASMPSGDPAVYSAGLQYSAWILRLSRAIDDRDAKAARLDALALTAAFASAPPVFRGAIAVILASHAALLVGDRALVCAWRVRCEGGLMDLSPYRAWLDAEIARLDGDAAAVVEHVGRARGLADRIPDAASRLVFDERLDALS